MSWIKKWAINCSLVFFGIFVACCVAEVALRVLNIDFIEGWILPRYYFQKTDYGFDITPNFKPCYMLIDNVYKVKVWSNEIGCFDYPIHHFMDNKKKILLLGDSFTWSSSNFNDKWGTLIEKLTSYPVLKCGVGGYGTKQEYIKCKKILQRFNGHISLIIVGYYVGNDLLDDYLYPRITVYKGYLVHKVKLINYQNGKKKIISDKIIKEGLKTYNIFGPLPPNPSNIEKIHAFLKHNSQLYRCLLPRIKKIFYTINIYNILKPDKTYYFHIPFYNYKWIKTAWQNHLKNLYYFKKLSKHNNIKLIFVLIPTKEQVYPDLLQCRSYYDSLKIDLNRPNLILRHFFKKNNITYLDLLPLFKFYARKSVSCPLNLQKDLYWRYDCHWNPRGEHLAGLLLSKYLLKHNFITVPEKQEKIVKINQQLMEEFGKLPPDNLL